MEEKYAKQLVVIGVHTPRFDSEKDTGSIRKAMHRYEINHPVVNDAEGHIAKAYQGMSWPTVFLIDPEGNLVGKIAYEKVYGQMDKALTQLIKVHRAKKTLNEQLLPFQTPQPAAKKTSPLFFPGKVLADAKSQRLFIADSTNHRIVITDLEGKKIACAGNAGNGKEGRADGPFSQAKFGDPQGLALAGDILYVADRKNMLIRALDLKKETVKTVAGTGSQGLVKIRGGSPLSVGLNSPWGLWLHKSKLYIAMAGHHQIWTYDLTQGGQLVPFAGNGMEQLVDGNRFQCSFAQPSGLGSDGTSLFIADCESSSIRALPLDGKGFVRTLVGTNLFVWGDKDGVGNDVRLQHPLDVVFHQGKIYLTDTYNHKIKVLDPVARSCTTLEVVEGGEKMERAFDEPAGLSIAGDKIYVADTNAHRIRVIDLPSRKVSTLALEGVEPP